MVTLKMFKHNEEMSQIRYMPTRTFAPQVVVTSAYNLGNSDKENKINEKISGEKSPLPILKLESNKKGNCLLYTSRCV